MEKFSSNDAAVEAPVKPKGRKPVGAKAMTPAERMRRSRAKQKEDGSKYYRLRIDEMTVEALTKAANGNNMSRAELLHFLLLGTIDRFIGIGLRAMALAEQGATEKDIEAFWGEHLFPDLPSMEETRSQPSDAG